MTTPEHQPHKDLDRDLVVAYAATFIPRDDLYPLQLENGRYISIQRTLYPDLIAAHLKGFITIGAYALDPHNQAKWLCLDADDHRRWQGLIGLARDLADHHVPSYLEPSRRGGHLWLFTSPLPGSDIRRLGRQLLTERRIDKVEIYPKQDQLRTGPGSFVRLPLGKHRVTGHRYHFVTLSGEALAPTVREQIAILATPQRISQDFIDQVLDRAPPSKPVSPTPRFTRQPKERTKRGRSEKRGPPSERIKAQISVRDFVSQYVELDAQGRGYCPFHDDQHRSFGVSDQGNFWSCFAGCGGGSIIDFWMKWREKQGDDPSFTTTVAELAHMLL